MTTNNPACAATGCSGCPHCVQEYRDLLTMPGAQACEYLRRKSLTDYRSASASRRTFRTSGPARTPSGAPPAPSLEDAIRGEKPDYASDFWNRASRNPVGPAIDQRSPAERINIPAPGADAWKAQQDQLNAERAALTQKGKGR